MATVSLSLRHPGRPSETSVEEQCVARRGRASLTKAKDGSVNSAK